MTDLSSDTIAKRCGSHARGGLWCWRPAGHPGVHVSPTSRRWDDTKQTHYSHQPDHHVELHRAQQILEQVCDDYGVTLEEIRGHCLERWAVEPRHAAMVAVRDGTRLSLPQIGALFDRHHTTVLHALRGRS